MSRDAATRLAWAVLVLACASCGGADESDSNPSPAFCEGTWQGGPWDVVTDTTFLRGPFLQSVMDDEAVVVWRDAPGGPEGCVQWSLPDQAAQTTCAPADGLGQYEVRLPGLPRDRMVSYRVAVGDRQTGQLAFRSAPVDQRPVRLTVFADAHRNESTLAVIAAQAMANGVDGVVSVGDQVDDAEESQFDEFLSGLRPLLHRVPLWPVMGNHENYGEAYFNAIVVPGAGEDPAELYYGVRFGSVWMAALDLLDLQLSAGLGKDLPEAVWLKKALASQRAQTARWRLLFIHHSAYSAGWGHCDGYHGEETLRRFLVPLAADYHVAAIFSGDMHGYEHGAVEGVHLFVTGGAGGGLDQSCETPEDFPSPWTAEYVHHALTLNAGCDALSVEARRLDGTVIETTLIE